MSKNKILLVDDDLNIRETITELLLFQNYDVKNAANGQEALDILEYWSPDLIICDIMMPIMDGNILHEIIKTNQMLSSIPFIFLTAKKEQNLMRKCLLDGADDFLSKPFKISELTKIIKVKIDRFQNIKNVYNNLYVGNKNHLAHEINTPLNGILGAIDLLIDTEVKLENNEIETFYDAIKVSGERLNRTMQNLALYQNLKSNLLQYNDGSNTDILKCFFDVKAKLFQIYGNQENRISFQIDRANIKISQNYLNFILFELIDNALKFSPSSKIVCISGERHDDSYYELVIRDFGIGFSDYELKKIGAAQQFNRDEREQQGLGLGLFLSKIIIKNSKGNFSIISKVKEGTIIKIRLPLGL
ncbi:MAG: response regulator [Bacteroidota bacterium]|jgi:two-component system sensor histidine kinase/response regulator